MIADCHIIILCSWRNIFTYYLLITWGLLPRTLVLIVWSYKIIWLQCSVIYINWSWLDSAFLESLSLLFQSLSMLLISLNKFYFFLITFNIWGLLLVLNYLLVNLWLLVLYIDLLCQTVRIWRLEWGSHCIYSIELLLQIVLLAYLLLRNVLCWIWKCLLLIWYSGCGYCCAYLYLWRNCVGSISIYNASWFRN